MPQVIKPFLLSALLGISFSDYLLLNIHNIEQKHQITVIEQNTLSEYQTVASNFSQNAYADSTNNRKEYQRLMQLLRDHQLSKLPFSEVMQTVASQFIGARYREGLLDQGETEKLFISFTEFDCVLFVESVLAFSRNLLAVNPSYDNFVQNIQELRYTGGKLDGYCSRLHYFSEWIRDNQQRGIVSDRTEDLGGIPLNKTLNFMSSHWQKYPRLKNSKANYQCILAIEKRMEQETRSQPLRYIPSHKIHSIYTSLKSGDIVAIVTDIKGLDTTHTGLVYLTPKSTSFIHASPSGKVKIAPDLHRYIERVDHAIGIMVVRPQKTF
ncbi:MAG: N-acetylmuramoyl-L-alanine amidase-like domain-containing protein [Pseudanabaena sp.]